MLFIIGVAIYIIFTEHAHTYNTPFYYVLQYMNGIQICIYEVVYHQLNIENNLPLFNVLILV